MKLNGPLTSLLLGIALLAGPFSFAATVSPKASIAPPKEVESGGFFAFKYWFAKKLVVDVDKKLQKLNIHADFCTFRQNVPPQDFSYRGAGPCLFKAFSSSMKTDQMAGTTYVWVRDANNQYRPVEIQWRPPHGGWMKVIKQYFAMRFEKHSAKKKDLPFKEFIGGEVRIIFPQESGLLESVLPHAPGFLKSTLSNVDAVSLRMEPTGRENGHVVYTGKITLEEDPSAPPMIGESPQNTIIHLKTDINIVLTERPFYVEAKLRRDSEAKVRRGTGAQLDATAIPPFPQEFMP